jgi:hypothetical protein
MQFWRGQGHSWETDWENVSTEIVGNPIFVGREPNKLALSSDGLVLCVGPNGRTGVRTPQRFAEQAAQNTFVSIAGY